ncbi:hypothetical protein SARC_12844, partial [Sphaeroforma arctica JP610]
QIDRTYLSDRVLNQLSIHLQKRDKHVNLLPKQIIRERMKPIAEDLLDYLPYD